MKRTAAIGYCLAVLAKATAQPINYVFTPIAGTYTALSAPTAIPEIYWGADNELSGVYNIGFTFQFGCTSYTQYKVSADGWLTFNLTGSVSFADAINDLSGYAGMRPGIAPLWDDLAWNNNNPPQCGYQLSGLSPNRVLSIQWQKANWKISGSAPGEMSFQIRLYETSNRIEMIYHQETGTLNAPSASIGLAGVAIGDYYSVNTAFTSASKSTNTQNIASKVPEGQIFRWDPTCALPITLTDFSGENEGNDNVLHWSTATETDNDYFAVERRDDNGNFTGIGWVKGAGNSSSARNYEFTDVTIGSGINYYRLKQTDLDNTFSYSPIIAIGPHDHKADMTIYPNPASEKIRIRVPSFTDFELRDVSRKLVRHGVLNNGELDVSDLENGFYFLEAGDHAPKKIMVQH